MDIVTGQNFVIADEGIIPHLVLTTQNAELLFTRSIDVSISDKSTEFRSYSDKKFRTFTAQYSCRSRWYWSNLRTDCSCVNCSCSTAAEDYPSLETVILDGERLTYLLLRFYYKDILELPRDLRNFEIRYLGPSERHVDSVIILAVVVNCKGVNKALLIKIGIDPWNGIVKVLNMSDFKEFIEARQGEFQNYILSSNITDVTPESWLKNAINFYVYYVLSIDSFLRYRRSLCDSSSNFDMLCNSGLQSLTALRHPTLPISIVMDEDIDIESEFEAEGEGEEKKEEFEFSNMHWGLQMMIGDGDISDEDDLSGYD
jgi:hypothetical protein